MTRVVLGLGSNTSYNELPPLSILRSACRSLKDVLSEPIFSSVYRSKAMYLTDQDDFHNMAVTGFFGGSPRDLLAACHRIEAAHGRDRSREVRNGPRPLDLDIELFGDERISEPDLVIPHERLLEREFVLRPMLEILSACADVSKEALETYRAALASLGGQGVVLLQGRNEFTEAVYGRNIG